MRILAIADAVSPVIYSENFPGNLPPIDLVLAAGDLPGYLLEFVADKLSVPPVYVMGNHGGYLRDEAAGSDGDRMRRPGGCLDAHLRVVEVGGLLIAGFEGSARYRPGLHQYTEFQFAQMTARLAPRMLLNRHTRGRSLDVLLTHAPPTGPHAADDWPHRGIPAFEAFARRWRPRLHVHGHVHLMGANSPREYVTPEGVRVINAYDFTLIELD